ncbi:hypothetical protein P8452_71664 [Trifolium repens]|nr:hypothetical protein P8452_71664 [Trifolium repens]
MAKFQSTLKHFALFVALIAFNYSLQSHARLIKPLNKQNVPILRSVKKIDSSMKSNNEVAFQPTSEDHTNAFQPTTPGNSPGVGHKSFAKKDINMKSKKVVVQSPDDNITATNEDIINDLKKTDPGHSPGVGHSFNNKIGN